MIIELNPFKWGRKPSPLAAMAKLSQSAPPEIPATTSYAVVNPWKPNAASTPVQETHMASFTSILSDIESGLKKFFGVAVSVATAAEPFVDQLFPGVASLYNTVLSEVAKAEAAAVAAGAQNGTGAQKLALVVQAVAAQFPQYTPAQLTIIINGVVAGLNAIPAPNAGTKNDPAA